MSQRGLIYSFAAKGTVVLAEHTSYSGNFSTIAVQCLQKLPSNSSKYTYSCDGHTFNFLIDNGFGIDMLIDIVSLILVLIATCVVEYPSLGFQFFLLLRMNRLEGACRLCFLNG